MFSKSKINEPGPRTGESGQPREDYGKTPAQQPQGGSGAAPTGGGDYKASAPKSKPPASVLSADLHITGNIKTTGDVQIEGQVEGDIRAHLLTIGDGATVKGECIADDVVINGRIVGRVRGLKVRLSSTARVEGDIIHKTIAIESGAHFEGSVQRQDDPLNNGGNRVGGGQAGQQQQAAQAQSGQQAQQQSQASSGGAQPSGQGQQQSQASRQGGGQQSGDSKSR